PVAELLKGLASPFNVHKILAIRRVEDVYPYVSVLFLVPKVEGTQEADIRDFNPASVLMPPGLIASPSGFSLENRDVLMADWPEEDRSAFNEFVSGRAKPLLDN
uniref:hypothetical protein n=1 Tax=Tabrizicola sp. TaxID=2005166 RepID=UPI00286B1708